MYKKNVIILGGNTPNNISWIENMKRVYKKNYKVSTLFFDHWKDNTKIDFEKESEKLRALCKEQQDYIIIAKSAGSILAAQEIKNKRIHPKLLIVMGFPLKFALKNHINIKDLFNDIRKVCKILIIQQKFDPQGNSKTICDLLNENITIQIINGNKHVYANFDSIKKQVDDFIETNYL